MISNLKKELNVSIIASIAYILFGIVVLANPEITLGALGMTLGIFSVIYGIVLSIIGIANIREENSLIIGILLIILGITLLVYPNSLSILISIGVGLWYIVSSVAKIKFSVFLKEIPGTNWLLILIGSILTLFLGITFIFTPQISAVALTQVTGILMIVYSIIDIIEIITVKKHISEIEDYQNGR